MKMFSIVVPTYKRPALLRQCLEALCRQDYAPEHYEIIVCDDGPDAGTETLVSEFASRCRSAVHYVPVTGTQGPAGARNQGWKRAEGRIVAFTDDDCIPDSGWLKAAEQVFRDRNISAAMGKIVMPVPAVPTDYQRDAKGLETADYVTANAFFRRKALAAVGGFDERFRLAWREDTDLFFSVMERQGTVVKIAAAVVVHPLRPAPWGISLSQQRKAFYNALIYKKHPRLYREKVQRHPPFLYYAILGLLLISGWTACNGFVRAAQAGLLGWVLLTAYFILKRLKGNSLDPAHIGEMIWTSLLIPPLAVFWRLAGAVRYRVLFF